MKTTAFLAIALVLALATVGVAQASDLIVAIDRATEASWTSLVSSFEQTTGASVTLASYSSSSIPQQIVLQAYRSTKQMNLVMVPQSWISMLARYLVDLTSVSSALTARGVELVTAGGRTVGVPIPFADGWSLAVVSWPANQQLAIDFLAALAGQSVTYSATEGPLSIKTTITVYGKEKIDLADHNPVVDGSLEALLGAVQQTLGSVATQLMSALPAQARGALATLANLYGIPFSSSTSTVTVVLESSPGRSSAANVAALGALGVSRSSIEATSSLIKVSVPVSQLSSIVTQLTGVSFIRPPYVPYPLATTSQGVAALGADVLHASGNRGAGTKIAVIDLGFSGLSQAQARGDLPYTVNSNDLTGTGLSTGITHGTAVAEIIHDMAPDAQLYLIKIADEVDLDLAVTYCLTNGIDIINHSLGWYNTNFYDGTGTIADIAKRAIAGGILWVNAAGNEAESHWEGYFADGNVDGWHDQNVTFHASSGSQIILYLTWNDWPQASSDYDLYLFDPASNLVASSTKHQTGTEEPTETINVSAPMSGTYTIRFQGSGSRRLELFNLYQALSPNVTSSSILAPGNVAEVVTVAAIDFSSYTTGPQEPYSSQGPTNDGRTKPDLAAPDNISTGTAPYTTFPGTSGAAPNVAGAAALLLSANPALTEPALRADLLSNTIPMGSAYLYGNGRLELTAGAPSNLPPTAAFVVSPSTGLPGQWLQFNATTSQDPDGSIVSYAWSYGDGATGTGPTSYHSFSSAGTYTVQLTVTDDDGATGTITEAVVIGTPSNQPPTAAFTVSPGSGVPGTTFTFNASASSDPDGSIVSYQWNFGDGSTAVGLTAQHAYVSPGTYSVQLLVRDDDGATDAETQSVSVQVAAAPDLTVESFTASPTNPTLGQTVAFSIRVRNIGNASTGLFRVRLTGGASSAQDYIYSLASGAAQTLSLNLPLNTSPETFTVVADDLAQVAESNESNNDASIVLTASVVPVAADAGGPYAGTAGSSIAFDGSGSSGPITTYLWSFGDGGSTQGINPLHTYATPGSYTVTLTVYGSGGAQSTDTAQVTVSAAAPPLAAQLSLPQSSYEVGDAIVITFTTNRPAYVYLCEVSPDNRVVLLYPNWIEQTNPVGAGTHVVPGSTYTLRVSEPTGPETLYLFAATGPVSGFPSSFSPAFPVLSTNPGSFRSSILSTMQSQFASGDWAFDTLSFTVTAPQPTTGTIRIETSPSGAIAEVDGSTIGTTPAERSNLTPGSHSVEVSLAGYHTETRQATVVAGQTTTVQIALTPIPANAPPVANFTYTPPSLIPGDVVQFNATASYDPDGTIVSYAWEFDDGSTGSGMAPSHQYMVNGDYTVSLAVTDNEGGTTTYQTVVSVSRSPEIGWISPTAHEDPADNWYSDEDAYDDRLNDDAWYNSEYREWTSYLFLSAPGSGLQSDRVRFRAEDRNNVLNALTWDVDVFRDGQWVDVFDDFGHEGQWTEIAFGQGLVTRMRIRAYGALADTTAKLFEVDFHDITATP